MRSRKECQTLQPEPSPVFVEPFRVAGRYISNFNSIFGFRESAIYSDIHEVSSSTNVVKRDVEGLIECLSDLSDAFLSRDDVPGRKEHYYAIRDMFTAERGSINIACTARGWVERAHSLSSQQNMLQRPIPQIRGASSTSCSGRYKTRRSRTKIRPGRLPARLRIPPSISAISTQSRPYISGRDCYFDPRIGP